MNECDICKERLKICYSSSEKALSDSNKYATVIVSLAFVTIISIFYKLYEQMGIKRISVVFFLLIITIGLFILNELVTLVFSYLINVKTQNLWNKHLNNELTLIEWEKERIKLTNNLYIPYLKVYPWIFFGSIISGFSCGFVLLNFSLKLFFN